MSRKLGLAEILQTHGFARAVTLPRNGVILGGANDPGIKFEPNQYWGCFSIRSDDNPAKDQPEQLIHFCDWPAMRNTIDALQEARYTVATEGDTDGPT